MMMPRGGIARVLTAAELPVLMAIAPALLFPTPKRLLVLALVPLLWLSAWRAGGRLIPRTPMNAALGLLLVMVGVSLYATFDIIWSLGKVAGVVLGVLFFWAVTRWLVTDTRLKVAAGAFVLAGAVLCIIGLLGTPDFYKFHNVATQFPAIIRGVPGAESGFNPNAVAGCVVLFVPLQVALLLGGAHRWAARQAWTRRSIVTTQVLLLLLTAGTALVMQSRAAWFGLAVAGMAGWAFRTRIGRALAVAAAVVLAIAIYQTDFDRLAAEALTQYRPRLAYAVGSRFALWSKGIEGIREYPVTGMGMNAFRKLKPVRYPIRYRDYIAIPDEPLPHSHNHLLQAALDLGLPGLVAYLAIWLIAATLLVRVYRLAREPVYRTMAAGIGAGLIAHFVFNLTDAIPLGAKVGILFWLTLAFTVGLHHVALPASGDGRGGD